MVVTYINQEIGRQTIINGEYGMVLPLEDIKVLDLSRALTGPYCTMMLSDFGAEVIKVEMPEVGDETRQWGPPFIKSESAYFLSANRGKKSITLNLKDKRGRDIIMKLAKESDIVVENFRPGVVSKLGIDYKEIKKVNPNIIYCSISGFGQGGPYRDRPAYDLILQGMAGLMAITGLPNMPPVRVGVAIADILAGIFACKAIILALYVREKTGRGQFIDVALLDSVVATLTYVAGNYFATGKTPPRLGSAHPMIAPYQAYKTKDMYINIAVGNENLFKIFCETIGGQHLMKDPRFQTNPQRVKYRDELTEEIEKIFAEREGSHWIDILTKAGVPCGPVYMLDQLFSDPQIIHREMVVDLDHSTIGKIKVTGIPQKLSETPCRIKGPPPILSEHTEEILLKLGYKKDEIEELKKDKVI